MQTKKITVMTRAQKIQLLEAQLIYCKEADGKIIECKNCKFVDYKDCPMTILRAAIKKINKLEEIDLPSGRVQKQ